MSETADPLNARWTCPTCGAEWNPYGVVLHRGVMCEGCRKAHLAKPPYLRPCNVTKEHWTTMLKAGDQPLTLEAIERAAKDAPPAEARATMRDEKGNVVPWVPA